MAQANGQRLQVPRFDGRVVVVTGAGRGQGAAEAAALVDAGATVVACDVEWAGDVEADTGPLYRRRLDVSDVEGWSQLAEWLSATVGRVHGLVNNAGVVLRDRVGTIDIDAWNHVMAVNVGGALLGMQSLLPLMDEGASIVNIGSLAALTGHPAAAYTASKWALRGLSRAASLTLGGRGIRCNVINPGFIETPMTVAAPPVFRDSNIANTSLARPGVVADIVPTVLFLLSDASSFITGAEIPIDGGQSGHAGAKAMFDAELATTPAASR